MRLRALLFHRLTTSPSFQRFEADFGNLGPSFSAAQIRVQYVRPIPILSIGLDFLEELPDDSVRHANS